MNPTTMTDEELKLEAQFLTDRLSVLDAEQKRRAQAFMEAKLGVGGAAKFRLATAAALAPRPRLFTITPLG